MVTSSSIRFLGAPRQESYLKSFRKMAPECQSALREIYAVAHRPKNPGDHVLFAMKKALDHPAILKMSIYNIILRIAIKSYQARQNDQKVRQLQENLDDFHAALDQFIATPKSTEHTGTQPTPVTGTPDNLQSARIFKRLASPKITALLDFFRRSPQ